MVAAVAILSGVVVVAMGGGGELALFRRDLPPIQFRLRTAEDVAMLQLPLAPLGYQEQAAGEAFRAIARLLDERDAEIARLRAEIRLLRYGSPAPVAAVSSPGVTADAEAAGGTAAAESTAAADRTPAAGRTAAADESTPAADSTAATGYGSAGEPSAQS